MAIIYPDLAGAFRRSIGGTVYYMRFGENLVRRKGVPKEDRENSVKQEKQQQRFKVINILGAVVKNVVDIGFPGRKRKLTGVNMFVHVNTQVWQEVEDEIAVDFSKLLLAQGSLLIPTVTVAFDEETRSLLFNCSKTEAEINARENDRIFWVVIDPKNGFCRSRELCERGTGGDYTLTLPDTWAVKEVQIYVFALSNDGKQASKSVYLALNP